MEVAGRFVWGEVVLVPMYQIVLLSDFARRENVEWNAASTRVEHWEPCTVLGLSLGVELF